MSHWTAERVVALLEEAGATLFSLPGSGCYPAGFRTAWPEFARGAAEAYGYGEARVRLPRPPAAAISRMDLIYSLVQLVPADRRVARRIVLMRSLVYPLSARADPHVWSWRQLAKLIGADPRSAQVWHDGAIRQIVRGLQRPGLCAVSGGPVRGAPVLDFKKIWALEPV